MALQFETNPQSALTPPPAAPNLSFNPGANIDTAPSQIALQQQQQQQNINQQSLKTVQETAQQASGMVQSFVQAAQQRQRMNAVQTLASLYSRQNEPTLRPGAQFGPQAPVDQNGQSMGAPLYQPPEVPFGQTPQFRAQQLASLMQYDPQMVANEQAKKMFAPVNLDQQYQNQLYSQVNPADPNSLTKAYDQYESVKRGANQVLSGMQVDGNQIPTFEYNKLTKTGTYLDGTQVPPDILAKAMKAPSSALSPYAEIKKQTLINTMNQQFSKTMDPNNWGPNTLAGKSAALVANADSAVNLADQMLAGKIPTTNQTMLSLSQDVNRVLTQSGVSSEKLTEELRSKTGYGNLMNAVQFFTNSPQDQKAGAFVQVLKNEVARQRDQRQAIVDRTLKSNLSASNQLRKMDPDQWESMVDANGLDVEQAKKGKFKLKPDFINSIYGTTPGFGQPSQQQSGNGGQKLTPQQEAESFLKGL